MKLTGLAPFPGGWRLYRVDGPSVPIVALGLTDQGTAVPLVSLAPSSVIVPASEVPDVLGLYHVEDPERPGGSYERRSR